MLKPADAIESDGETVVNSPEKRAKRNETTEIKAPKIRKIADLRMNADELGEMRSRIAKSVTVWRWFFVVLTRHPKSVLTLPAGCSSWHGTFRQRETRKKFRASRFQNPFFRVRDTFQPASVYNYFQARWSLLKRLLDGTATFPMCDNLVGLECKSLRVLERTSTSNPKTCKLI